MSVGSFSEAKSRVVGLVSGVFDFFAFEMGLCLAFCSCDFPPRFCLPTLVSCLARKTFRTAFLPIRL